MACRFDEGDRVEVSSAAKAAKEVGLRIDCCVEAAAGRTAESDATATVLRWDVQVSEDDVDRHIVSEGSQVIGVNAFHRGDSLDSLRFGSLTPLQKRVVWRR